MSLPVVRPPRRDVALWRGNDDPAVVWSLSDIGATSSDESAAFSLIVQWPEGEFVRSTVDGAMSFDASAGTVTWPYRLEETLTIPRREAVSYELIRVQDDATRTVCCGEMLLGSGLPRDPAAASTPVEHAYVDLRLASERAYTNTQVATLRAEIGAGGGAVDQFAMTAAEPLSGHRIVRGSAEGARYASIDRDADLGTAIGLTLGAAAAGAPAILRSAGPIDEPSWSWVSGPVFLGLDGRLTQAPQAAAFLQQIGVAAEPTRLILVLGQPIRTL